MAISVGSVEVDVVPNTRGIYQQLRAGLVPAATRAGEDAGSAAGRSFGPAMQAQVGSIGLSIGEQIGQQIANRLTAAIRDSIGDGVRQGGAQARASATRQGDQTGGAFSRALKTRLEAAFRSLPKLQIDADTSEADSDLQALRVRMETLADKRIGIDISAGDAKAEIRLIEAELTRLGAEHPNVQVRADTAAALAQLAAVRGEIAAVDGKRINIRTDVSTAQAKRALLELTVSLAGVAAIPVLPVAAAGLGAIASAATAAAVGVGAVAAVAVPAFIDIAGALQAQKAAQDAATTATAKGNQAAVQAQQKAIQQAGAQQALASAHRSAATSIRNAERSVSDAVRQAAEANATAAQQIRQARQGLADAVQQAADRQQAANERVQQAERSLVDAQRSARQAQLDLTQARRDAAAELQDLSNRLAGAQLSERDATLSVQEAQARLRATQAAGSKATLLEQQRAQLAYDQAVQRLKEQRLDTRRLAAEKRAADKAGVEGSDTVRSAQDRLAQAQRNVRDQQAGVAKAQQEAARQQIENTRTIAEAQGKLASAQANVAKAQADGARSVQRAHEALAEARVSAAESIAGAERQVQSASLASASGTDAAATAQAKYQAALAKLTPSARDTFNAFVDLRGAFRAWSRSLQPAVMPLFTRALIGLKNSLPGLTPFVLAAARAIGTLQDRVSRGFKSPWWQQFKKDLAGSIGPAIVGLGVSFGNIFRGMAGVVQAFLPHMNSISTRMQTITARFAAWGTSLKGSPAFESFLRYAAENGPLVARTIGDIGLAFYQVARALEPLSGPVLQVLGALARGVASIAVHLPWLIQGMYLAYVATRVWTIAMWAFNAAAAANPIGLIILAIVALVAGIVYAYKRFSWFHNGVNAAWSGIRTGISIAWNVFIKPAFEGIKTGVLTIGRGAMWLWRKAISPAFSGISLAGRILAAVIGTLVVAPIVIGFRLLSAQVKLLWRYGFGPAFRGIAWLGGWLWKNVLRPQFTAIRAGMQFVGNKAKWLWTSGIRPYFGFIADKAKWVWTNGLRPAFSFMKQGMQGVANKSRWLYDKSIRPSFGWISNRAGWLWSKGLRPAFDRMKEGVRLVGISFGRAKDAIGRAFGKIAGITKKPVNFVIRWVYTRGIKAVWDRVAGFVGLPKLPNAPKLLAQGGTVGNGFGPASPMAVNRPTAIVGEGNPRYPEFVIPTDPKYRNRAQALHAAAGTRLMEDGGILGGINSAWDWTKDAVSDAVGKGINWAKTGADLLTRPSKVFTRLTKPILDKVTQGVGLAPMGRAIARFPVKMVRGLKDMVVDAVRSLVSGGANVSDALKWAKAQAGKPYQWGGAGNPSYDCSGFMAAIQKKIVGQNPKGRLWSTFSFQGGHAPSGWRKHKKSPFMIGVTNKGKGHTAGTLAGTNVESRGGDGVLVGKRARGYRSALFGNNWYGFMPAIGREGTARAEGAAQRTAQQMLGEFGWNQKQFGPLKQLWQKESGWRWNAKNPSSGAYGIAQALPPGKMRSAGADWKTNPATQIKWGLGYIKGRYGSPLKAMEFWQRQIPHWYDGGGYLQPGMNLAYNGTGRPEPVFTSSQADALMRAAAAPASGLSLDGQRMRLVVGDREFDAYVEVLADGQISARNEQLLSAVSGRRRL